MKRILPCGLMLFLLLAMTGPAAEREILVGDPVRLRMTGVSREEIARAFDGAPAANDVRLEDIRDDAKDPPGNVVTFRSFLPGELNLRPGNLDLTIHVASALTEADRARNGEIYLNQADGDERKLDWGKPPYRLIAGIALFLAGLFLLTPKGRRRTRPARNPFLSFERDMADLPADQWEYRVSVLLRELIDYRYGTRFLTGDYEKTGVIDADDVNYIKDLDDYKFSRKEEKADTYQKRVCARAMDIYGRLRDLAEKEKQKGAVSDV
ncbi:MAG: hypothetical protein LBQ97_07030 [Fusobacteriaceae bacterium]|jgi:hypothetical protein|nr:hypothetical protein [Fusobacteriaceae bacterium]